jgi:hypothetical protein
MTVNSALFLDFLSENKHSKQYTNHMYSIELYDVYIAVQCMSMSMYEYEYIFDQNIFSRVQNESLHIKIRVTFWLSLFERIVANLSNV